MATLKTLSKSVKFRFTPGAHLHSSMQDKWQRDANGYHCYLTHQGSMSVDYWMGRGIHTTPTVDRVLDNLLSDASGLENSSGFEDWANELGYDLDEMEQQTKARKIYKAVVSQTEKLREMLGSDYNKFMNSERE